MAREFKERENYVIKIGTELVPVTKEVYEEYHKMERHERYLEEKDRINSLFLFSTLRVEGSDADVPIKDESVNLEEDIIKQSFLAKLPKALALLSDEEIEIIRDLYWNELTIRELAEKNEMSKSGMFVKRDRILAKLRKILEDN